MLVALDYDGTYTADPKLWAAFVSMARMAGHEVVIATMRFPSEPIDVAANQIIYTGRKAKAPFLASKGLRPSIWIDDNPAWIYKDAL